MTSNFTRTETEVGRNVSCQLGVADRWCDTRLDGCLTLRVIRIVGTSGTRAAQVLRISTIPLASGFCWRFGRPHP
jgi:hypothetical protein